MPSSEERMQLFGGVEHEDEDYYTDEQGLLHSVKTGEVVFCEAETHPAVYYLSNGDPGYPAEYCEDEATHLENGLPLCKAHTGYGEEDYGPEPDDEPDWTED